MWANRCFCFLILVLGVLQAVAGEQDRLFLVTNDDGFDKPGLAAIAEVFQKHGTVLVVAPKHNSSGVGHGITYRTPIFFGNAPNIGKATVIWLDAKPATCVQWGIHRANKIFGRKPDLVISGINMGENLGVGTYYSGTVGAAREAAFHGIPAIAASSVRRGADYSGAAELACRLAIKMLETKQCPPLININYPTGPIGSDMPMAITFLTKVLWDVDYEERVNPQNGSRYCWVTFGVDRTKKTFEEGSDAAAVYSGQISVTPMKIDVTEKSGAEILQRMLPKTLADEGKVGQDL